MIHLLNMGTFHSYVNLPESSFQNSTIQGDCSISTSCRRLKSSFLNGFKSLLQQKFPRVRGFLEAQNLNIQMGWCKNWDSIRILPTRTSTWWQLYTIMNYNDLNFHGLHVINIISSKKIWQFIQRSTFLFCSYIVHVINRSQIWQWHTSEMPETSQLGNCDRIRLSSVGHMEMEDVNGWCLMISKCVVNVQYIYMFIK